MYRPGKSGGKPDALTRRSQDLPEGEDDSRLKIQHQVVLKPRNLEFLSNSVDNASQVDDRQTEQEAERTLEEIWTEGLQVDSFPTKILGLLRDKVSHSKEISLAECE